MKQCPTCHQVYLDESLNFCLSDGSALISGAGETETVVLPPKSIPTNASVRAGVNPAFAYIAIGLLALILGGGLVAWMKSDNAVDNRNVAAVSTPSLPQSTPLYGNTGNSPATYSANNYSPKPEMDTAAASQEVQSALNGWLQTINNRDLSGRMGYYASRLDRYYTKTNVSSSMVRTENEKAFGNFTSLNMSVANVRTDVDATSGQVLTTFDKTFNFQGPGKHFEGAVKSEFRWSKIGGQWKITSERDLKVYRVNKG